MLKKISTLLLLLTISLPSALAFSDVESEGFDHNATQFLIQNDIIEDSSYFRGSQMITRGDYITWLLKNQGVDLYGYSPTKYFIDTNLANQRAGYISKAVEMGVAEDADYFHPTAYIDRLTALRWLMKAEGYSIPLEPTKGVDYIDVKNIRDKAMVEKASAMSIAEPLTHSYFGATQNLTRSEAAEWIYRTGLMHQSQFDGNGTNLANHVSITVGGSNGMSAEMQLFQSVWDLVHESYYDAENIDDKEMIYSTLEGMMKGLGDTHSVFQRPEALQAENDSVEGNYYGIGAYIGTAKDGRPMILSPMSDSPSEKAGVKAGDIFVEIDGIPVSEDANIYQTVNRIKGEEGTVVEIVFERDGKLITKRITRGFVDTPMVEWERIGDTAVVKIYDFGMTVGEEFGMVAKEIKAAGINKIILDLRNNPGGYVDGAADIMSHFTPKDTELFYIEFGEDSQVKYLSDGPGELGDAEVIILQNENTASASEILTMSLEELGKVKEVVGQESYGKGIAQRNYPLTDGSVVHLTVARWKTPKGDYLPYGDGIDAEVEVVDDPDTLEIDEALERALAEMK